MWLEQNWSSDSGKWLKGEGIWRGIRGEKYKLDDLVNRPLKAVREIGAAEFREGRDEQRTRLIKAKIIIRKLVVISTENVMWDRKT